MKKNLKEYLLIETINIYAWYNQLTEEKLNKIDFKIRWALKRFISQIAPDVQEFEKMRDDEVRKIQSNYISDEKSEEVVENVKDADGNDVLDENGNVQTTTLRKIRPEFMDEYNKEIDQLNAKINEILAEKNSYEYNTADIDAFVDSLDELEPLTFNDLEIMQGILGEA